MENAIAARMMTDREARECVAKINAGMTDIRWLAYDLYILEGWLAMGYNSWRECAKTEFKMQERYIYRQLEAAQTEKNICPIGQKEEIPESQLRPLIKLRHDPEKQKEAYRQAVATAPDGKVTAAHVYKIVKGMTEPEKPKPTINKPIIQSEQVSPEFQKAFDQMVIEIKNARAMKWKTTSHKGAIEMMEILLTVAQQ